MTNPVTAAMSAGWYADPAGSALHRWWDGTKWTEHLLDPTTGLRNGVGTTVLAGISPHTGFIWALAVLGLAQIVAYLLFDWEGYFANSISVSSVRDPFAQYTPEYLLLSAFGWLGWLAGAGLALGDWLALRRRGVPRPFHFAWVFLASPWVYVIGRSVVVQRRVGFGMAPLWVFLAVQLLWLIVSLAVVIPAMINLLSRLPTYSTY